MESSEYYKFLRERRQKLIDGYINCIPSPFPAFSDFYLGIEQKTYYCMTANTGIGKSQISSFMFLFNPVLYAYHNPGKVDLHIFYYALEETEEEVTSRFVSYLLFTMYKIRISKKRLSSVNEPVDEHILDLIESDEIKDILDFFHEHVEIICDLTECNPTGIYKTCKKFAKAHGKEKFKTIKEVEFEGTTTERKRLVGFKPDNDNSYWLVIIDHIGLIPTERGMNQYDTMKKLSSEYFIELRNIYGFSPIVVAQQTFDENEDKGRGTGEPTKSGIADCKAISRDFNVILGLHSPYEFKKTTYQRYNITYFEDHFRALIMLKGRDGGVGKIHPLYFDGCTAYFHSLPSADNIAELKKYYDHIKKIDHR